MSHATSRVVLRTQKSSLVTIRHLKETFCELEFTPASLLWTYDSGWAAVETRMRWVTATTPANLVTQYQKNQAAITAGQLLRRSRVICHPLGFGCQRYRHLSAMQRLPCKLSFLITPPMCITKSVCVHFKGKLAIPLWSHGGQVLTHSLGVSLCTVLPAFFKVLILLILGKYIPTRIMMSLTTLSIFTSRP